MRLRLMLVVMAMTVAPALCVAQARATKEGQPFCGHPDDLLAILRAGLLKGSVKDAMPESCLALKAGFSYDIVRETNTSAVLSIVEVVVRLPGNEPMLAYTIETKE